MIVAAGVVGLLTVDYTTVYQGDHNPDESLSLWLPMDWYNIDFVYPVQHEFYIATPHYWWLVPPFWPIRSNR